MKPLVIADAPTIMFGLQDEIRRSEESRYDHRLHGVLLVAQGMGCGDVARLLGDAPRTVQYWIRRFEEKGLAGLVEGERSGRPMRIRPEQLLEIGKAIQQTPDAVGFSGNVWDGKTLAVLIEQQYGVTLGVRQCQRLFLQLGFRLRKPRSLIVPADPPSNTEQKKHFDKS